MRKLICILFLLPFFGLAQFNVKITAINLEDNSRIPYVHYQVGHITFSSDFVGRSHYGLLDVKYLDHTLQITHGNFKFEERPLFQHEYEVVNNTLILTVYGRPWKKKQISLDLALAKSKKVKNDTVRIPHGLYDVNALLSFEPSEEINTKNVTRLIPYKRVYDNLCDGNYVLTSDAGQEKIPFQKENWMQTVCLNQPKERQYSERELNLLKKYFLEIDAAKQLSYTREREYEREKDHLQQEIDELNREIDRLKGVPVAYPPNDYPEPVIEEPEAEIFMPIEDTEATPINGYDGFISDVKHQLVNANVRYSGNVTLEIYIEKDGRILVTPIHTGSADKQEIIERLNDYLVGQRWNPAKFGGRAISYTVILSLNIIPSK